MTDKESIKSGGKKFGEAASILSSLAIEGIRLSREALEKLLEEDFGLPPQSRKRLIEKFAKNGDGKDLRKNT